MDVETLERILRAYAAPTDRTVLKAAIDDPEHGDAFSKWASLHLGPENLLTKDELAL